MSEASPLSPGTHRRERTSRMVRAPIFALLLALIWWWLSNGEADSWLIGVPAVVLGTAASLWLRSPTARQLRLLGLFHFMPYFLWHGLAGGLDVAWRSLHPGLPLHPALIDYPFRLPPEGPARAFFASVLNLLPGTLGAELHDTYLTVHVLDTRPQTLALIHDLEEVVARLFGVELPAQGGARHG